MNEQFDPSRRHWLAKMATMAAAAGVVRMTPVWASAGETPGRRAPLKWVPGLQLYTLGLKDDADLGAVFKELAAIGYREVEFAGNYGKPASALRKLLDSAQLTAPSTHVAPQASGGTWNLDDVPKLADELKALGANHAIIGGPYYPGISPSDLLKADGWKRTADFLNEKGAALREHGIRFAYHNHATEFLPLSSGSDGYRLLVEYSDPKALDFELDIGWAVSAKQDLTALFKLLGDRVKLLHLKDTKQFSGATHHLVPADVGTGIVKWGELVELMRRSSVEHAFVEQEPPFPTTPMGAVKHGYRFLTRLFAGESV